MFGKKKKEETAEVTEENVTPALEKENPLKTPEAPADDRVIDEVTLDGIDQDDKTNKKEMKKAEKEKEKAEKAKVKEEKKKDFNETEEILNSHSKTKAGQTFKMYKFIIKIVIFAILLAFGIVMLIYKAELIGAVYLVTGIVIAFSAIIRMIPLLKTSRTKRARLVTFIQCLIHLVIGAYLIIAAFYHWNKLNEWASEQSNHATWTNKETIEEKLKDVGAGWAVFNMTAYAYILVAYLFTLSAGYFWVTILYKEETNKSLFWLMFVADALAVAFALFAEHLDAENLVIAIAIISMLGGVVVAGEAGGGYWRYRKALTKEKKKDVPAEVSDGKNAPAKDDKKDYSDIDPNTIPVDEPSDGANIVS